MYHFHKLFILYFYLKFHIYIYIYIKYNNWKSFFQLKKKYHLAAFIVNEFFRIVSVRRRNSSLALNKLRSFQSRILYVKL